LGTVFLFASPLRNKPAGPQAPAVTTSYTGGLSPEKADYIASSRADKSCQSCLAAADAFLTEKKTAALHEKTKGMSYITPGEYHMGSPDGLGDPDEHPERSVTIDAFYIDQHEITIAEYMKFVADSGGNHPEWGKPEGKFNIDTGGEKYYKHLSSQLKTCADCPIVGVTFRNAEDYCRAKNKRLPTEAEWETAARSGSNSAFSFGDDPSEAGDYAWYEKNSGENLHQVGQKKPNSLGIYDMHGNVWEWVSDLYDKEYYAYAQKRNPQGAETGREHVIRGGSWAFDATYLRSANRASSERANDDIGFRCAVSKSEISPAITPNAEPEKF